MIKVRKNDFIALGLSDENMKRLAAGQPIKFNGKELNLGDITICIYNGRTEESMAAEIDEYVEMAKSKLN